jgi:hypothetical protein
MSMRTFDAVVFLMIVVGLSACNNGASSSDSPQSVKDAIASVQSRLMPERKPVFACTIAGKPAECTYEWRNSYSKDARILVLMNKQGGFRRISVAQDGSLRAADGAEELRIVRQSDGVIEVSIASDEFHLAPSILAGAKQ